MSLTQHESNVLHPAVSESLLPVNALLLESSAGGIKIIDRNADVTETLRLIITVVVLEVGILLRSIIPCKLEQTLTVCHWVYAVCGLLWRVCTVSEEV